MSVNLRRLKTVPHGCSSIVRSCCSSRVTPITGGRSPFVKTISDDELHWRQTAIAKLWQERKEMGHTPLVKLNVPGYPNVDFFLKNETASPTRTLKHRFSWALLMWAVSEGKIQSTSTVYESTSGNTGSAEAYMCRLIGVPYYAVVSKHLEEEKINQITSCGGRIIKEETSLQTVRAIEEATKNGGYFINQFSNANKAEEFHESGDDDKESTNVFHEILVQLRNDDKQMKKIPDYFIHSAGTGGTISSVGRYISRYNIPTSLILADSQYSLFYDYVVDNRFTNETSTTVFQRPGVAGTGFGYNSNPVVFGNTTSLVKNVIHEAIKIPDIATNAAMIVLRKRGISGGASTALNFLVALCKAHEHKLEPKSEDRLTIATLIADPGEFYDSTYFNADWRQQIFADRGGNKAVYCWEQLIEKAIQTGSDFLQEGLLRCNDGQV